MIVLVSVWRKSVRFRRRYARKMIFTFSFPVTLTFDLALLVTLVQRYVFTKLDLSTAFLFRENRMHGMDRQTDRRMDGRITSTKAGRCLIKLPWTFLAEIMSHLWSVTRLHVHIHVFNTVLVHVRKAANALKGRHCDTHKTHNIIVYQTYS